MSETYTYLGIHFIFSTKNRSPFIDEQISCRLYSYIGGIIKSLHGIPIIINGMPDHIHIFCFLPKDISVSDFMRIIKSKSSKWIHETFSDKQIFQWQEGYGAFSVNKSLENKISEYIKNQSEHHRKRNFQKELIAMLDSFGIQYNGKYIWQ